VNTLATVRAKEEEKKRCPEAPIAYGEEKRTVAARPAAESRMHTPVKDKKRRSLIPQFYQYLCQKSIKTTHKKYPVFALF
jgi:hypothetical protein